MEEQEEVEEQEEEGEERKGAEGGNGVSGLHQYRANIGDEHGKIRFEKKNWENGDRIRI